MRIGTRKAREIINVSSFYKTYAINSLNLALEEYRLDSAFNSFQPKFLLSQYNKQIHKFGIRSSSNSYFQNTVRQNEVMEDALSFAADLSALFVIKNNILFNKAIVEEATSILNRPDQYIHDGYLLGFGYFLKRICFNGPYAIKAISKWVTENAEEIISGQNINISNVEVISKDERFKFDESNVKCISFSLELQLSSSRISRNIRINTCDSIDEDTNVGGYKLVGSELRINIVLLLEHLKEQDLSMEFVNAASSRR